LVFYSHFCAHGIGKLNGLSNPEDNEVKSKMKDPSDIPTPRFKHGW